MRNTNLSNIVSDYLRDYAGAPYGIYPNPSSEIVDFLRKNPKRSFETIANGVFLRPQNLDPRDLGAPLCKLLTSIVDLVPNLLIPRMTKGFWASRYLYISSAAQSKSPLFIPTIINLLEDRSIYIKSHVLGLIVELPHLQVFEAMAKFEKLSKMKSFQNSENDRKLLEKAKMCVSSRL